MLKTRVIPILLHKGSALVKGEAFKPWRQVGHALQAARVNQARNVDELIVLNVDATPSNRAPDIEFIKQLTSDCFMPLTIGGGIRHASQVREILASGADKVAIGTAAVYQPYFVRELASKFGNQAVVVAIDVNADGLVTSRCGTKPCGMDPVTFACLMQEMGAGELLLTSIPHEGKMQGYNLDLIKSVANAVSIPVIANGGAATYMDFAKALRCGAHAVAAGALFQFEDVTPADASTWLDRHGFAMRLPA